VVALIVAVIVATIAANVIGHLGTRDAFLNDQEIAASPARWQHAASGDIPEGTWSASFLRPSDDEVCVAFSLRTAHHAPMELLRGAPRRKGRPATCIASSSIPVHIVYSGPGIAPIKRPLLLGVVDRPGVSRVVIDDEHGDRLVLDPAPNAFVKTLLPARMKSVTWIGRDGRSTTCPVSHLMADLSTILCP
jgi:hypothetical protein